MSTLSDSLVEVTKFLYDWLEDGKTTLQLEDVWYDIEGLVPRTPCVIVEPLSKQRVVTNTGHMVENTFEVNVILLHSRMASKSATNEEAMSFAEDIEGYLHSDKTFSGKLIHSYVTSFEQGSVNQQKVLLRATRLLWRGMSKTRI